MRLALGSAVGFCVALAWASAASAGQAGAKAEARRHHELGQSSLASQAYGQAIAELNQAYDLGHDFAVLYDIGRAYVAMEQPVFAVKTLKKYLAEGGKQIAPARRKEVEATITEQERRIATVIVQAPIAGTVVRVDGIEVGRAPLSAPIELGAGPHLVSASAAGYLPWEMPIDLVGGDRRTLEVRLLATDTPTDAPASATVVVVPPRPPLPPPPAPDPLATAAVAPTPEPPAAAPAPFPTRKVVTYAVGGVGVAALVVGGIYGARAISKRNESDDHCPNGQCTQRGVDLNNQAKTAARVADVTLAVGLVGVAVATYLWLRPEPSPQAATSSRGLHLAGGLGPHEASVALRGAW